MNRTIIEVPAEKLPVITEADVVVFGGGTSGFIAVTAAARTGGNRGELDKQGWMAYTPVAVKLRQSGEWYSTCFA